ncbi:hypothetical protein Pmar_PMAR006038 [Perkinsus marinus ATCC 50983]|uniref:Uncharacterized protein n=1 Tax=Perkinsus marinus (strain ATCC 50983 / TXsc) TaxID=423536 RepID=C5LA17_PERM5|nr:hypothetical protein Pmar_PMAR006038 [Perkinsus marinus ATCC 50983]EER06273.1 hypothetical protein Pmar_PMAR006038 [Perkinsus marinus ATCC 50983]|eukprot:XP_002774457.1 hypothetical protein Pmar_PMAR006038 [Perkinsus marinus ATCC 50983]
MPELEKHVYKSSLEAGLNVKAVEVVADPSARMRKALNHHSPSTAISPCLPDTYSWALALYSRYGFRTVEPGDLEGVGNFGQRRRSPSYEDGRGHLEIDLHKAIHIAGYDVYMIDYVYMPYDVRQKESSTYVFVNVKEAVMIEPLYGIFEGRWWSRSTAKEQRPARISYARCHGLSAILNSLSRGAAQQLPACYRPLVAVTLPQSSPQLEDTGSLPLMAGDDGAAPPSCPIVERSKSVREPPPALQLKPTPDSTEIVPQSPTAFLPKHDGIFPTPKVLLEPGSILVAPSSDEDVVSHDSTDRSGSQEDEEACRADGQASTHAEEQCLSTAMMMVDHCLGVE